MSITTFILGFILRWKYGLMFFHQLPYEYHDFPMICSEYNWYTAGLEDYNSAP